jgi:8-oxo-dGTP pyrophosphatase MutT (NUDIX family)
MPGRWPAIEAAHHADTAARLPLLVADGGRLRPAGSVARAQAAALMRWPEALQVDDHAVTLRCSADLRSDVLAAINTRLHAEGLVRGWRHETYALPALDDGTPLAAIERAAARFWGSLTFGAHCNGYVADVGGRPTHLWIARRADTKPTDPGLLDNLIGGGVPQGQSPAACVLREGWEEAGLSAAQMAGLRPGRRIALLRNVAEGLQREQLSVYDLALPAGLQPRNQDGEVQAITLLPVDRALACAADGEMTVDAALATLDFALRHALLPPDAARTLAARAQALWLGPSRLDD